MTVEKHSLKLMKGVRMEAPAVSWCPAGNSLLGLGVLSWVWRCLAGAEDSLELYKAFTRLHTH